MVKNSDKSWQGKGMSIHSLLWLVIGLFVIAWVLCVAGVLDKYTN